MVFWSWLRGARPNTLEMKCFCLQTCKMRRYLCKEYVFNISKINILGKKAWKFSGNITVHWTTFCDHNWGERSKTWRNTIHLSTNLQNTDYFYLKCTYLAIGPNQNLHDFLATPVLLKQYPMLFWSWLRGARPNTLEMKCFCLQTCKMQRYLCKVYVFNISKIDIFGKNAWFSGNTPFYWNNTPRCSDHNWGGQGPIHYQAKGKKCACPGKWIFNTSKIG